MFAIKKDNNLTVYSSTALSSESEESVVSGRAAASPRNIPQSCTPKAVSSVWTAVPRY